MLRASSLASAAELAKKIFPHNGILEGRFRVGPVRVIGNQCFVQISKLFYYTRGPFTEHLPR